MRVSDEHNTLEKSFVVKLLDQNEPPVIISIDGQNVLGSLYHEITMNENSSLEIEINATDPEGDFILFSKTAGDDRHLFDLNTTTGNLKLTSIPDFELPIDSDSNNSYSVWFRANSGNGFYDEKRIIIQVLNVIEDLTRMESRMHTTQMMMGMDSLMGMRLLTVRTRVMLIQSPIRPRKLPWHRTFLTRLMGMTFFTSGIRKT